MPNTNTLTRFVLPALLLLLIASGCKKEFDTPPVRTIDPGGVVTIAELKAMYQGIPVHFADTAGAITTVYGVVTADEENGNLYKNLYIQDHTGAMAIRLLFSGGLFQGDSIRIHLPGTVLSPYNGLMQLDSVDVDNNVIKQATGKNVAPLSIAIGDLTPARFGLGGADQGKLITIQGVQFIDSELGLTYADPVGQQTMNRTLENCVGTTAVVRSSGYANFAGQQLPTGRGTFTGIASWFGNDVQLYIRDIGEVQLNGLRCDEGGGTTDCDPVSTLNEDFSTVLNNQPISLACWENTFTEGNVFWRGKVDANGGSAEARISLGQPSTMWLVTPWIEHTGSQHLSFSSAHKNWVHDGLSVWVSTDFDGDAGAATWHAVSGATLASEGDADDTWVASGQVNLSDALPSGSDTFVVAFKYEGDAANSTTFRIDNVVIQ